jgi:aryl-alcohol dehydrogenase-like predicted oxidoreductase
MPYLASDTRYNSVPYNRTGNSGLKLPQISLGWWYNFGGRDTFENGRAIARRAVTSALIGASSVKQLEDNLASLNNINFSDDELGKIEEILK